MLRRFLTPRAPRVVPDFSAALVLLPPEDIWPPLQKVRAEYDQPVYERWPQPHLQMLWPFVPSGRRDEALEAVCAALRDAEIAPFTITFHRPLYRERAASSLLYLDPVADDGTPLAPLQQLGDVLQAAGSAVSLDPRPGLHPHLRLGVGTQYDVKCIAKEWTHAPLAFEVADVCLVESHAAAPFRVTKRISLAGRLQVVEELAMPEAAVKPVRATTDAAADVEVGADAAADAPPSAAGGGLHPARRARVTAASPIDATTPPADDSESTTTVTDGPAAGDAGDATAASADVSRADLSGVHPLRRARAPAMNPSTQGEQADAPLTSEYEVPPAVTDEDILTLLDDFVKGARARASRQASVIERDPNNPPPPPLQQRHPRTHGALKVTPETHRVRVGRGAVDGDVALASSFDGIVDGACGAYFVPSASTTTSPTPSAASRVLESCGGDVPAGRVVAVNGEPVPERLGRVAWVNERLALAAAATAADEECTIELTLRHVRQ